jgi:NADPH-dependent curcumin reductase CurA
MIEGYNGEGASAALPHLMQAVKCRMTLRGFISTDYLPRQQEFETHIGGLIAAGKVRAHSTVLKGLNSVPDASLGLFRGENMGKMLVKL